MDEAVRERIQIFVRYFRLDDDDLVDKDTVRWLGEDSTYGKWRYMLFHCMEYAHDWALCCDGDLKMALYMANKLAQIIKVGRSRLQRGYEFDLVMVRDVTKRTITPLDKDNAMIVLALTAL